MSDDADQLSRELGVGLDRAKAILDRLVEARAMADMRQSGMSLRALATVFGCDKMTVKRRLRLAEQALGVSFETPTIGIDGKTYGQRS